jgi:hypothetical protein
LLGTTLKKHGREYTIKTTDSNELMLSLLNIAFDVLKVTIGFIGHLGYIGGITLYAIGNAITGFGKRLKEVLRHFDNAFGHVGTLIAHALVWVGFAIKNSFGLKPLTIHITDTLHNLKEETCIAWSTTEINRENLEHVDTSEPRSDACDTLSLSI